MLALAGFACTPVDTQDPTPASEAPAEVVPPEVTPAAVAPSTVEPPPVAVAETPVFEETTLFDKGERAQASRDQWRVREAYETSRRSNPKPVRLRSAAEILHHEKKWHGKFVELEGEWYTAFETSYIDEIWISMYPDVKFECEPNEERRGRHGSSTRRARLEGFLLTKGGYGHLSGADAELTATHVAFLDTPGCTPSNSRARAK